MKLHDLFSIDDLEIALQDGYVRERRHPLTPNHLTILNYTERAQYENHWTDVTRQCRGLIVRNDTDEVIARPFDKFFNLGEHDISVLHRDAAVEVTDKMDGSLGILYHAPDGPAIATRGSFNSVQAIHATEVLRERYADFTPAPGITYLFEIVYPENRIVLDYQGLDDLVLIGARNLEYGHLLSPVQMSAPRIGRRPAGILWPGPVTEVLHTSAPFASAIQQADRENREGIVVRFLSSGLQIKVKQDDYVLLHKLVTGLNERAVWEHLSTHDGSYHRLLASVPDEFHQWVTEVAEAFLDEFETLQGWAHDIYHSIVTILGRSFGEPDPADREYRAAFAQDARNMTHPGLLFQMLDGRDISPAIWKTLKPKGETPSLLNRNEDNS